MEVYHIIPVHNQIIHEIAESVGQQHMFNTAWCSKLGDTWSKRTPPVLVLLQQPVWDKFVELVPT